MALHLGFWPGSWNHSRGDGLGSCETHSVSFPPRWACVVLLKSSISTSSVLTLLALWISRVGAHPGPLIPHGWSSPPTTTFLLKVQTHKQTKRGDPSHMQVCHTGSLGLPHGADSRRQLVPMFQVGRNSPGSLRNP